MPVDSLQPTDPAYQPARDRPATPGFCTRPFGLNITISVPGLSLFGRSIIKFAHDRTVRSSSLSARSCINMRKEMSIAFQQPRVHRGWLNLVRSLSLYPFIQRLILYQFDPITVPVRRVKPAYYHALKRVQNAGPVHPRNEHKEEIPQAPGLPDDHTSCRSPITSPSGMRYCVRSLKQCSFIRFPGLTRSLDGADTRFISPLDPHSRCSPIPNVGALPTHDVHLWQYMQKANNEFEELKKHLRCIKVLVFRLLVTSCRLILSVIWHITVCAFPIS